MKKKRNNRTAGHNSELYFLHKLEKLHNEKLYTTRHISRLRDSQKVDIENDTLSLPIKYQSKQSINTPKYTDILDEMKSNFDEPCVILYQKTEKKKVNFCRVGDYAIMTVEDFERIVIPYLERK